MKRRKALCHQGDIGTGTTSANQGRSGGSDFAAAFKQRPKASVSKISAAQKARIEKIRQNAERKELMKRGLEYDLNENRPVHVTATMKAQAPMKRDERDGDEDLAPFLLRQSPLWR